MDNYLTVTLLTQFSGTQSAWLDHFSKYTTPLLRQIWRENDQDRPDKRHHVYLALPKIFNFFSRPTPAGRFILEVPKSHTMTHHSRQDSSG